MNLIDYIDPGMTSDEVRSFVLELLRQYEELNQNDSQQNTPDTGYWIVMSKDPFGTYRRMIAHITKRPGSFSTGTMLLSPKHTIDFKLDNASGKIIQPSGHTEDMIFMTKLDV